MLPVASPQHVANDYAANHDHRGPPFFLDPIDTALGIEGYQEVQSDNNHVGMDGYNHQEGHGDNRTSSIDVDLETFKNQKIQEFRKALEFDIERKRQQAQKDLEDAERQKWEQLMEFQQSLQREMAQNNMQAQSQQQYMSQPPPSPSRHQQGSMMASVSSMQQHPNMMSNANNTIHQYNMGNTSSQMQHQQPQQQQATGMLPTANPMYQQNMDMLSSPPASMQQQQQSMEQSMGMAPSSMPQHSGMTMPTSSMYQPNPSLTQQDFQRGASPMRRHQYASPMRQHQYASPIRQTQPSSPMRQTQPSSPMRQTQPISPVRTAAPMYQQQYNRGGLTASSMQYHGENPARTASPIRQQGMGTYNNAIQYNAGRTGSPIRHQIDDRTSSPMRQQQSIGYPTYDTRNQPYHTSRSTSTLQSRPSYNEPAVSRSYSQMSNAPAQHRAMSSSTAETPDEYYRAPSAREVRSLLQQDGRGGSDGIWRTRGDPETIDDHLEEERTFQRHHIPGAQSAGAERTMSRPSSKHEIHSSSTWNPSPRKSRQNLQRELPRQQELLDEAERLEREYAQLTRRTYRPSKATALMQVKKMQEERRRKLEALTARVVQNRRRLAHEMKTADRPLEISFVEKITRELDAEERLFEKSLEDSREEHHTPRKHQIDKRDEKKDELPVVDEAEEPSETETGMGLGEEEEVSSESGGISEQMERVERASRRHKNVKISSSEGEGASEEEPGDSEGEREEMQTRDFVEKSPSKVSKRSKQKGTDEVKSKRKERKGKKNADEFVEKLRQRRSRALDRPDHDNVYVYNREDVLGALEKGEKMVTLPSRDPKAARKNRKLSSQKLRESSRASIVVGAGRSSSTGRTVKIAKKKSTRGSKATSKIDLKKAVARDLDMNNDADVESRQVVKNDNKPEPPASRDAPGSDPADKTKQTKQPPGNQSSSSKAGYKKKTSINDEGKQMPKPKLEKKMTEFLDQRAKEHRSKRNARASSTVSLVSDLSESAYGVAPSYTGSGVVFENGSLYNDGLAKGFAKDVSETTTSVFDNINFEGSDSGDVPSTVAHGSIEEEECDDETKKKTRVQVRELAANSVTEGFEIEENSIYSKSAYSQTMSAEGPREPNDDPLTNIEALHELERKLDEQDRRSLMPELLELTELYGWDLKKLLKNFVHFLPHLTEEIGIVEELSLHKMLQSPTNTIRSQDPATAKSSSRPSQGSHRKIPVTQQRERRDPSGTVESNPEAEEGRELNPEGWRSRVRNVPASRSPRGVHRPDSIDMSDVRSSLKNLLKRNRRAARRGYKPELQSLNEH